MSTSRGSDVVEILTNIHRTQDERMENKRCLLGLRSPKYCFRGHIRNDIRE